MKASIFKAWNKVLTPPKDMTSAECSDLHVWTDGERCISCWKGSFKERIRFLFYGKLWLYVRSGNTQPAVGIVISRDVFKNK